MSSKIEFISYTGEYPTLCHGVFTVKIDGKIYHFGHESDSYDFKTNKYQDNNLSDFWRSGGEIVSYSGGLTSHQDDWILDDEKHDDYPEKIKSLLSELIKVFNDNVPQGCCGGCI